MKTHRIPSAVVNTKTVPLTPYLGLGGQRSAVYVAVLGVFCWAMVGLSAKSVWAADASLDHAVGSDANGAFVSNLPAKTMQTVPVAVLDGMYAANAKVGKLQVTVDNVGVPADGRSELLVRVTVYDLQGELMKNPVLVTIENTGGKVQLLGTADDEFGNTSKDADRSVPGIQLKVLNGVATFGLIAPSTAQDVKLRLTAGNAYAAGVVPFGLDLREMVAAGLIEGVLRINKASYASTVSPVRIDDGFEQEITRLSRSQTATNGTVETAAVRAAFFLKGKISGDTLLTMSYDSDKETRARLLRDIKPEQMYPVYGDDSVKGFDARSSDRLYVRVDKNRSFALYGDYNTGDGFSQSVGTGMVSGSNLKQLATYNRSLTGVKGHLENETGFVNAFAAYDTLKNVTEEIRANGTSGPFAVNNTTALENSEKIEVLVRDKNNLATIVSVTPLIRLNDYVFEPFSSRILLTRALPSLDSQGNPLSLRVSYEVDQGGEKFLVAGVDGDVNLGKTVTVGGSYIEDKNPIAPVKLASVHAGIKLGERTQVVAEIAQSKTGVATNPISLPAATTPLVEHTGKAARVEITHTGQTVQASAYVKRSEADFMNQSAGTTGAGTQQVGARANVRLTDTVSVDADVQRTNDLTTDAHREGERIGVQAVINEHLSVRAGVRGSQEHGVVSGTVSAIGCNPTPGSTFAPASGGGFSGANSSTLLNLNGVNCPTLTNTPAATTSDLSSTTVYVGADARLGARWSLMGTAEVGTSKTLLGSGLRSSDTNAARFELGVGYQASERTRLYVRGDNQRGLSSQYGLNSVNQSSSVSFGVDSTYMQGGNVFSEYRLRDAMSAEREAQWATGLRNAWQLNEGWLLSTSVERLKVLSGGGQNATAATLGLDYTGSAAWKGGTRLEWRRLDANASSNMTSIGALKQQDTVLWTINAARKLSNDWTGLARNYYLATNNHGEKANGWQDRLQLGFAYRPVVHNHFDALGKLEYKTENNINNQNEYRRVWVGAVQANYHPSRPWWVSGRLAGKSVVEQYPANEGGGTDSYKAYLLSGRVIYDITESIDLGLNFSMMNGRALNQTGSSVQKGLGLEVGYAMTGNLWASLGYNFTGYTDKDLTSDYTGRGAYLRLRYKFDQDLFESNNPKVNNTIER
jgi:hypothetical protein